MMLCSRACVLLSPRDLVPSCSHEFMLSGSPIVMPSCYRASKFSYRKESGKSLLFCYLASRLVFSDSLPSSVFIPSESIRSLSNSLPVLARTGFENRAPVEAKRSFLKIKVLLSRGRLQEPPKLLQELSKRFHENLSDASIKLKRALYSLLLRKRYDPS